MGIDLRPMALKRAQILLEKAVSEFPASEVRDRATRKDRRTSVQARAVCKNSEPTQLDMVESLLDVCLRLMSHGSLGHLHRPNVSGQVDKRTLLMHLTPHNLQRVFDWTTSTVSYRIRIDIRPEQDGNDNPLTKSRRSRDTSALENCYCR